MKQSFTIRVFVLMGLFIVAGAAIATTAYWSTHGDRSEAALRPLVLTVFATPCATLIGWLVARRQRGWEAAFWCFMLYFFSIFLAARIERLAVGETVAASSGHSLYFKLTVGLNVLGALVFALREARGVGTMAIAAEREGSQHGPGTP